MFGRYRHSFELFDQDSENEYLYPRPPAMRRGPIQNFALLLLALTISITLNLLQAFDYDPLFGSKNAIFHECRSQYGGACILHNVSRHTLLTKDQTANLRQNEVRVEWLQQSEYTNPDAYERDRIWDKINYDSGIVAVPKQWAEQKGLALGVDLPWNTSKSMYFINAFHSLHCVVFAHPKSSLTIR